MDKNNLLDEIFNNDPYGLLDIKPKASLRRTPDELLLASFQEINDFVAQNDKVPEANHANVSEYMLHSRLTSLLDDPDKCELLREYDQYNLLPSTSISSEGNEAEEINSIDDILNSDMLSGLNDSDEGLFDLKHVPEQKEIEKTDFVARRKPCPDFDKYEPLFKQVHEELATGHRKIIPFKQDRERNIHLHEGAFYLDNGVLFLLAEINISKKEHYKDDGTRVRTDGRTRCIFENGTQSNMLKRSVEKMLYANGKLVTENVNNINDNFSKKFGFITDEDQETGYIYVLKSKSDDEQIKSMNNLYKIGYSKHKVDDRIKNAEKEPTYLMAEVEEIASWKCYNLNAQKLEKIIHKLFHDSCLEVDIFDENGVRHTPREWFVVPFEIIEQAVMLISSGDIIDYYYDAKNSVILPRS